MTAPGFVWLNSFPLKKKSTRATEHDAGNGGQRKGRRKGIMAMVDRRAIFFLQIKGDANKMFAMPKRCP